jgi:hypothetical protein
MEPTRLMYTKKTSYSITVILTPPRKISPLLQIPTHIAIAIEFFFLAIWKRRNCLWLYGLNAALWIRIRSVLIGPLDSDLYYLSKI